MCADHYPTTSARIGFYLKFAVTGKINLLGSNLWGKFTNGLYSLTVYNGLIVANLLLKVFETCSVSF